MRCIAPAPQYAHSIQVPQTLLPSPLSSFYQKSSPPNIPSPPNLPLPPHRHRRRAPILLPTRPPPHLPLQQQPRPLLQPLRIPRIQLIPLIRLLPHPLLLHRLIPRVLRLPILRQHLVRDLGPHERALALLALHHLDRHLLRGARAGEAARAVVAEDLALDDEGADAESLDAVDVVEVVFEVELVEPERGEEGGEVGRLGRRAEEGEGEVGSVGWAGTDAG